MIFPGLVALRAYEAKRGGEPRKTNEVLVDILGYSLIADLIGEALLIAANAVPQPYRTVLYVLDVAVTFAIVPIALGWGWYEIQAHMVRAGYVTDPVEKPWDKVFERIVKEQLSLAAVITLRDGRRVAGRLVEPAYVSTYPAPEQILLGEMWRIDQTAGTFVERMRGSWGMLIDKADCETIEFIRWSEVEADLAGGAGQETVERQR